MPDYALQGQCDFQHPRQGNVIFQAEPADQRVHQIVGAVGSG
jgi:hypothetical protein